MNAASSHVTGSSVFASREVSPNETVCYALLMAPVGSGNLTVGSNNLPSTTHQQLPFWLNESVVLPVHLKVTDPTNRILIEQDIITPYTCPIEFSARGEYRVYLTNNGNESTSIPIGTAFEMHNSQNREADKYLLALLLTGAGVVCLAIGLIAGLLAQSFSKNSISANKEKQHWRSKP
jgi:hypothetical protein